MPRIDNLLDHLKGKSAFFTLNKLRVMRNGLAMFQRLMQKVIAGTNKYPNMMFYLNPEKLNTFQYPQCHVSFWAWLIADFLKVFKNYSSIALSVSLNRRMFELLISTLILAHPFTLILVLSAFEEEDTSHHSTSYASRSMPKH